MKTDINVFDIEMEEDDHIRLTNKEKIGRKKGERKSRLAVKAQNKALDSRVAQDVMEFTGQSSVSLTHSDEMPQKTVTHLEEVNIQSSGNRLGVFEDTLMESAEQVPPGSETGPITLVERFTERTSDTRHASAGVASELTNEQISMLGEMGDVDGVSSLSAAIHNKPAAVDIVSDDIAVSMDTTINVKSCPDSAPESTDQQSCPMAPSGVITASDEDGQGHQGVVDESNLPSGDDEGCVLISMEESTSTPKASVISLHHEALLKPPFNTPQESITQVSRSPVGLKYSKGDTNDKDELQLDYVVDQLDDFQNRKAKAETSSKNISNSTNDQFLNVQVPTLDEKQLELLHDKQPPEHGLGVVAASNRKNTTTSKKGTVSEATRKIIQQLERDLTAGTRPGPHVSRKSINEKRRSVVEEALPPPPPPGELKMNRMLSVQNVITLKTKDEGIEVNNGGAALELAELKEELSRAKEQISMLEACLKQSQDGGKWNSGNRNDDTEILIQGYQKENERLVKKLKEAKKQHENEKLSLYEERRQLGCQLNLLRNQVTRQSGGGGDMSTSAESLRSQLALEAKVLQLQEQLEQARKESAALRCTGMDVKPVQQPLGDELASVSVLHAVTGEDSKPTAGENSSQAELDTAATAEVRGLQDELSALRLYHESEVAELRQKMQWYVENAELVDKHIERLAEQDKEIERLKCVRAAEPSPRPTRSSKSCSRCVTSSKTIAKLKAQLVELENASMNRNPDNVSSMIRAAKLRSDNSEKEAGIRKIKALEKELEKTKDDGIVRLRALRQEHERVCAGLRKRLKMSESKTEENENFGGTSSNMNSITSGGGKSSNEREELVRMQQFYTKKLREAEQKIMLQASKIRRLSFNDGGGGSTSTQPQQKQEMEEGTASSEDKKLSSMLSKKAKQATHEERIAALEEKLAQTTEELCRSKTNIYLIATSSAASEQSHALSEERLVAWKEEEGGVKYDPEPIREHPSQQAQRKRVARVSRIPVPQATESFSGSPDPRLIASEETCKALRHQITELQKEISDLKSQEKFHSSPIDVKCNALAEQLNAVRRRAEARSLEVEHAVDSVRNEARIEMTTMQAKHRIELQSKGAEIDGLRRELDELLSHMSSLKSRSTVTATRV